MTGTAQRVFEHQRIWRVTPEALSDACLLLFAAISRDHPKVDHVIGIANGGVAPSRGPAGRGAVRPGTDAGSVATPGTVWMLGPVRCSTPRVWPTIL